MQALTRKTIYIWLISFLRLMVLFSFICLIKLLKKICGISYEQYTKESLKFGSISDAVVDTRFSSSVWICILSKIQKNWKMEKKQKN